MECVRALTATLAPKGLRKTRRKDPTICNCRNHSSKRSSVAECFALSSAARCPRSISPGRPFHAGSTCRHACVLWKLPVASNRSSKKFVLVAEPSVHLNSEAAIGRRTEPRSYNSAQQGSIATTHPRNEDHARTFLHLLPHHLCRCPTKFRLPASLVVSRSRQTSEPPPCHYLYRW